MPLIFVPKNFHIYKRSGNECPRKTVGLKHQLPSLADHFDLCFSRTTGEGLQLWFSSLLDIFGRWEPLHFAMSGFAEKINPCGALLPTPPASPQPAALHLASYICLRLRLSLFRSAFCFVCLPLCHVCICLPFCCE